MRLTILEKIKSELTKPEKGKIVERVKSILKNRSLFKSLIKAWDCIITMLQTENYNTYDMYF